MKVTSWIAIIQALIYGLWLLPGWLFASIHFGSDYENNLPPDFENEEEKYGDLDWLSWLWYKYLSYD